MLRESIAEGRHSSKGFAGGHMAALLAIRMQPLTTSFSTADHLLLLSTLQELFLTSFS